MKRTILACAVAFGADAAVPAASAAEPMLRWNEVQVQVENDKWAGTDRYYTNGVKAGVGLRVEHVPGFVRRFAESTLERGCRAFGGEAASAPCARETLSAGVFAGQQLYTPRRTGIATAQPDDRPWAAWLYAGLVLQMMAGDDASPRASLGTLEVDVGLVGPAALGEEVQNMWHRLIDVPEALGWNNQIRNEPAFLVAYLHKEKFDYGGVQLIPHAGVTLGTVTTLARAGALLRVGHNMTGFGPDRIEPSGTMLQNTRRKTGRCPTWSVCEWYLFAGFDQRLVAYNIFLDGTVFRSGPSVDRRTGVRDLSAGASVRFGSVRLTASRVQRSEEFTTPLRGGGTQTFFSFNLGVEL